MKNNKGLIIILALILIAASGAMLALWQGFSPKATPGDKTIAVEIRAGDYTRQTEVSTSADYLAEALLEAEIIAGEETAQGIFVTAVDGIAADNDKQQWWCVTKGGETLFTGVSDTPVSDGEVYELTLMTGY